MSSFRSEPILWIHVAGLATLPIFLPLCLLFLAVGDRQLPTWLELLIVAAIGILPLLWMQLRRPFYTFALLGVALKPEILSEPQRKILCLVNTKLNRLLAVLGSVLSVLILGLLYQATPLVANIAQFLPQSRGLALLLAGLFFLASNLFLQIPLSVAGVLVTKETEFAAIEPLSLEKIKQDFTILGVRVNQILPQLTGKVKTEE
ncbi:MAG: low-complexity tail membrane protein [Spirirestis rafaelensis WJT71-NPBG6]|nr:low-complexity tail membrane protein [Spirirestis rafaelensis WJT71-NPBG6]